MVRHTLSVATVGLVLDARFGSPRVLTIGVPIPSIRAPVRKRDRKKRDWDPQGAITGSRRPFTASWDTHVSVGFRVRTRPLLSAGWSVSAGEGLPRGASAGPDRGARQASASLPPRWHRLGSSTVRNQEARPGGPAVGARFTR
jgi:hypothetical protein